MNLPHPSSPPRQDEYQPIKSWAWAAVAVLVSLYCWAAIIVGGRWLVLQVWEWLR